MTLAELYNSFYTRPIASEATKMFVFNDEDSIDNWVNFKYFGDNNVKNFDLITILSSDKTAETILIKEWCDAKVEFFYAVEADTIAVLVKSNIFC